MSSKEPRAKSSRTHDDVLPEDSNPSIVAGEESIVFAETAVANVIESSAVAQIDLSRISKEDLNDYDEPVVLVVSKRTRDVFLEFLQKIIKDEDKEITARAGTMPMNGIFHSTSSPHVNFHEERNHIIESQEFDYNDLETLKKCADQVGEELNRMRDSFEDRKLKDDFENSSDLEQFRSVRKKLSKMYTHTTKALKSAEIIAKGQSDYLFSVEANMSPVHLSENVKANAYGQLKKAVDSINRQLMKETINECIAEIKEIENCMHNNKLATAKAWRSVKINAGDIARNNADSVKNKPRRNSYYQSKQSYRDRRFTERNDRRQEHRRRYSSRADTDRDEGRETDREHQPQREQDRQDTGERHERYREQRVPRQGTGQQRQRDYDGDQYYSRNRQRTWRNRNRYADRRERPDDNAQYDRDYPELDRNRRRRGEDHLDRDYRRDKQTYVDRRQFRNTFRKRQRQDSEYSSDDEVFASDRKPPNRNRFRRYD